MNSPGVVSIPPDRDLSLTEAIASVRGVSRLGNPKSITIKSVDNDGQVNLKIFDILTPLSTPENA